jgi:hypothetical protein
MTFIMPERYAIYDPRTDKDIKEVVDLTDAYAEIDRLKALHGILYGIRLAPKHRAQTGAYSEIPKDKATPPARPLQDGRLFGRRSQ